MAQRIGTAYGEGVNVADVLARGYLPKELPPCFSSASLEPVAAAPLQVALAKSTSYPVNHSLPRQGGRRRLQVPNPLHFVRLCEAMRAHWAQIDNCVKSSRLSRSRPKADAHQQRAYVPRVPRGDVPRLRARMRTYTPILLKADVTECYHSIYTHAVPWALTDKATAKQNKNNKQWPPNIIDEKLRSCQSGQTIGIPVGPDTSLIIAEVVLTGVDLLIEKELGKSIQGYRYYDDYELGFDSHDDASRARTIIERSLHAFELNLNRRKTVILRSPAPLFERDWVREVQQFPFSAADATAARQQSELLTFFDRLFRLAGDHPEDNVISYGLARLRSLAVRPQNWALLQQLMFQSVLADASALPDCLNELLRRHHAGQAVAPRNLSQCLNEIICKHAPLGHGSEVAWALWGLLVFDRPITRAAGRALSGMGDDFVAILALEARARQRTPDTLDFTQWNSNMSTQDLYEEHWLLAYEANVRGFAPAGNDYVQADAPFAELKQRNVSFFVPPPAGQIAQPPKAQALPVAPGGPSP